MVRADLPTTATALLAESPGGGINDHCPGDLQGHIAARIGVVVSDDICICFVYIHRTAVALYGAGSAVVGDGGTGVGEAAALADADGIGANQAEGRGAIVLYRHRGGTRGRGIVDISNSQLHGVGTYLLASKSIGDHIYSLQGRKGPCYHYPPVRWPPGQIHLRRAER
jgi:hypothetical protein